uniref:Uncharacterized protein n=1 Tax=Babesia bovis TaxID=5865 RepID=S6BHP6_BABBO|nr:hypothetical protein [Babesia bovis]
MKSLVTLTSEEPLNCGTDDSTVDVSSRFSGWGHLSSPSTLFLASFRVDASGRKGYIARPPAITTC